MDLPPLWIGSTIALLVIAVATWLFGLAALGVLCTVIALAAIVVGARASGWARPALIVLGTLLLLTPTLVFVDYATSAVRTSTP